MKMSPSQPNRPRSPQASLLALLLAAQLLQPALAMGAESLEATINRANEAANRQEYPLAIQLYEQAIQRAPEEKTFRNNLAVLYANYGVTLQEQRQFDQALHYFEKALALLPPDSPTARNVRDAQAGTYFTQAMHLRDNTEDPGPEDYGRMKALLKKALAISPDDQAFKKGLASVYLDEAYRLAVQEQYAQAEPLLVKAMSYDETNRAVRQSLANVYLGLAKNEPANAKQWTDKALAVDDSPRIQQVAAQLLAGPAEGAPQGSGGFAAAPGQGNVKAPAQISELSVAEMIRDLEAQLQSKPDADATMLERLEALEKQIYGKVQDGPLAVRAKNAYTSLMGSYNGMLADSHPNLVQAPAGSSENSYLDEVFKVTDGKVIRWGKFPIRVYIETPQDNPLFKAEYKEAVLHGLNAWKVKTNGFVNYVEIKDPDAADVTVSWDAQYVDRFADPETVPTFYKDYSPPKRNPLMQVLNVASMFAPGYFSLAPRAIGAAMQYQQYKKLEVIRQESNIKLGLAPTHELSAEEARTLIQNMTAKEFGHVLGLKASSDQPGDLLYPELRSDVAQLPSQRDLETLRELYNRPANIILNVR